MTNDLARRSHALLMQAIALEEPDRTAMIDAACKRDPVLARHVAALLAAIDKSGAAFEASVLRGSTWNQRESRLTQPEAIRNYRIVRVVGVGGMATVYEAIQDQPRRRVALKVLRYGLAQTSAIQRFRFETEVLARLQHPGIAQIFEAGTDDAGHGFSQPFFAMEYIADASTITAHANRRGLSLRDRLELFSLVCDAVQYGHQHGVIHRDLKPGNILVDARGLPKVIDFGVARTSDPSAASITRDAGVGQLVGTLNYMSREQCTASGAIDIRTDVYSLGVVLYELVCGRLPHDLANVPVPEALRIVREDAPARPGAIDPRLRGDIDAIVMTAMDKDPDHRYPTVAALAADIRRHLSDEPIQARPASALHHLRKFVRRQRALVAAAGFALSVLIGTSAWTTWAMLRWRDEAHRAQQATSRALAIKEALQELVASADPATGQADVRLVDVLRDASAEVAGRFGNDPEVEADLRFVLSRAFDNLALFQEALDHAGRADELYRELLGVNNPRALEAANNHACLLYRARRMGQAAEICREVITLTDGKPAVMIARTTAQRTLASIHIFQGEFDAAERLLRSALESARATLGANHGETLLAVNDMAAFLAQRAVHKHSADPEADLQEAVDLLTGAMDAFVANFGADGRHTLLAVLNLARYRQQQQRFDEAQQYAQRVLDLVPRRFGRDHGFCIVAARILAETHFEQRQFPEAARWTMQQVESLRRRAEGKNTADVLSALSDSLLILDAAGELQMGEAYSRILYDMFSAMGAHGGNSPFQYALHLARFLSRQGKYDEAEELFSQVERAEPEVQEMLRWRTDLCYGGHLAARGQFAAAAQRLLRAEADCPEGLDWPVVAQQELARLYAATGDGVEADRWSARATTPRIASRREIE